MDSSTRRLLRALYAREFRLLISDEMLFDLSTTLRLDAIRERHDWTNNDIDVFVGQLRNIGEAVGPQTLALRSFARDLTDTKFLDLRWHQTPTFSLPQTAASVAPEKNRPH